MSKLNQYWINRFMIFNWKKCLKISVHHPLWMTPTHYKFHVIIRCLLSQLQSKLSWYSICWKKIKYWDENPEADWDYWENAEMSTTMWTRLSESGKVWKMPHNQSHSTKPHTHEIKKNYVNLIYCSGYRVLRFEADRSQMQERRVTQNKTDALLTSIMMKNENTIPLLFINFQLLIIFL